MKTDHTHQLIQDIKAGKEEALKTLYRDYQPAFLVWAAKRFQLSEDDLQDVFQDVVIIFYKNVRSGKLEVLTSSLKTYLYGIGKNLLLKKSAKQQKTTPLEDYDLPPIEMKLLYHIEQNHQQVVLQTAFEQLKDNCRQILTLFYYKRYSTEAIMHTMNYRNTETVRSRKLQCLKALRTAFFKNNKP